MFCDDQMKMMINKIMEMNKRNFKGKWDESDEPLNHMNVDCGIRRRKIKIKYKNND